MTPQIITAIALAVVVAVSIPLIVYAVMLRRQNRRLVSDKKYLTDWVAREMTGHIKWKAIAESQL